MIESGNGQHPVRVFLDSADYSTLSDEKRCTPQLERLREKLIQWADSGDVEFWYSGTLLSEMAPLDSQYTDASVARTDLLVRLCKTQARACPNFRVNGVELSSGKSSAMPVNGWEILASSIVAPSDMPAIMDAQR